MPTKPQIKVQSPDAYGGVSILHLNERYSEAEKTINPQLSKVGDFFCLDNSGGTLDFGIYLHAKVYKNTKCNEGGRFDYPIIYVDPSGPA
jgi:hypothetical protein